MQQVLLFFENHAETAILISIFINIVISVLGIIPSFFLTAANITFFGFWYGTLISCIGESLGAVVSFYAYRLGFCKVSQKIAEHKNTKLKKLLYVEKTEAFYIILSLRLFPFIPSGAVNILAALGKVSAKTFILASSLGKIPALIIEAYSVLQITKFNYIGKTILVIASLYIFIKAYRHLIKNK